MLRACFSARARVSSLSTSPLLRHGGWPPVRKVQPPSRPLLLARRGFASSPPRDYYAVLGVERRATAAEIKKAYFVAAKKSHPDLNKGSAAAAARFREVAEAYETLKNPRPEPRTTPAAQVRRTTGSRTAGSTAVQRRAAAPSMATAPEGLAGGTGGATRTTPSSASGRTLGSRTSTGTSTRSKTSSRRRAPPRCAATSQRARPSPRSTVPCCWARFSP